MGLVSITDITVPTRQRCLQRRSPPQSSHACGPARAPAPASPPLGRSQWSSAFAGSTRTTTYVCAALTCTDTVRGMEMGVSRMLSWRGLGGVGDDDDDHCTRARHCLPLVGIVRCALLECVAATVLFLRETFVAAQWVAS